jgi:hypothetical protein
MKQRAAALMLAALILVAGACGSSTKTTTSATTATSAPTTQAPTTVVERDTLTAVFPTEASTARFQDPVAAATAFATDYAGFVNPVVGPYQAGDSRSGEVEIRSTTTGPATTVFVRQLGTDNTWWVLGASTPNITLSEPVWFASISSPVTLKGTSSAYEGTVSTQVREDDDNQPLGTGFVTGGSMGMGPFDGQLAFTKPSKGYGAVMLSTQSQEGADAGHTREVGVIRVRFAS